jgi:hypothetical protein
MSRPCLVVQDAAKSADSRIVFQRTPVTALPMQQRSLDPGEKGLAKLDYLNVFRRRNTPPGSFCDIEGRPKATLEAASPCSVILEGDEVGAIVGSYRFAIGISRRVKSFDSPLAGAQVVLCSNGLRDARTR